MARCDPRLIDCLRKTSRRLKDGAPYEWGHMGRCNCGHLIQTATHMSDLEIVRSIDFEMNEWTEHAKLYCDGTGHKVDEIFHALEKLGFNYQDMINLEYLSDPAVLGVLPQDRRFLRRNRLDDVILYMETLANILEKKYLQTLKEYESVEKQEEEPVPA